MVSKEIKHLHYKVNEQYQFDQLKVIIGLSLK